jgi:DNA-binding MarR family transcriptional regulator
MKTGSSGGEYRQPGTGIDRLVHEPSRYMIMVHLYVVESADYLFIQRHTGLTWGNLSSHLSKLEDAGYVLIEKGFDGKKPHTMLRLTDEGRLALETYRKSMKHMLEQLPEQEHERERTSD